jgi:ABC-type antimicrobial peptide transport system permease subunit
MIFNLSVVAVFALWIATFWFAKRRQKIWKAMMFYLGLFLVWPASTLSLGFLIADSALHDIKSPVGGGAALAYGFAFVVTLLIWLAGHALASTAGSILHKRTDFEGKPA